MIEKKIFFSKNAFLKTYVIEHSEYIQNGNKNTWQPLQRPAVIVCPGGGYKYIADSEDEPVVYHFLSKGYSVFTLHYSVGDESIYPTPLIELFKAIKYVRVNSADFWINPNSIVICGFSAGAHLVGLAATKFNDSEIERLLNCDYMMIKPNAAILCYPITNVSEMCEENPARVKTWGKMLQDDSGAVDVVKYVTNKMCPTFLWHTRTDGIVPITQSLQLISAMQANKVQYEAHIFGDGYHGLSTNDVLSNYRGAIQNGKIIPNISMWIEMVANWINSMFDF